jgi:HIV Tat-specific factor 1
MNGRSFGGQVVEAFIADGKEKYRKSKEKPAADDEADKEDEKRLDKFSDWIEKEGAAAVAAHGPEVGGGEEVR